MYFPVTVLPSAVTCPSSNHCIESKSHFTKVAKFSGNVASTSIAPPVRFVSVTPSFNLVVKSIVHVTWSNERTMLLSSDESFPGSSLSSNGPTPVFTDVISADVI